MLQVPLPPNPRNSRRAPATLRRARSLTRESHGAVCAGGGDVARCGAGRCVVCASAAGASYVELAVEGAAVMRKKKYSGNQSVY